MSRTSCFGKATSVECANRPTVWWKTLDMSWSKHLWGPRRDDSFFIPFPQICNIATSPGGAFPLTPQAYKGNNRKVRLGRSGEFPALQGAHGQGEKRPLGEFSMTIMPGSTVQCVNPQCEVKGNWMRVETVGPDCCPLCGEAL